MQPVVDLAWVRVALETQRDDHKQLADRLESVQELQVQSRASLEARLEALEARVSSELAQKRSMLNVEVGSLQHVLREVTEQLTTLRKKVDEEVASSRSNIEEQITKSVSAAVGLATSDLNTMYKDLATRVSKETESQTNAVQALQAAVAELESGCRDASRHCSKDSTVTLPPPGKVAPSPKAATAEMQEDHHHSVQQLAQQLAEMVNPIERMAVGQRSSSHSRGASKDTGFSQRIGGASTPRASAQEAEAPESGDCTPAAAYRSSVPQEGALPGALAKGKSEDIKKGLEQLVFLLQDSLEQEAFTWKTEMASIQSGQKSPFQGGHRTPTTLIPAGHVTVSSPTNSTTSGSQISQRPPSSLSSAPGTGQGTPRSSARLSFQVQSTSSASASRETLRNQGSLSSRHSVSYAPPLTSGSRTPSTPGSHASTPASSALLSVRRRVSSDSGWIRPLS